MSLPPEPSSGGDLLLPRFAEFLAGKQAHITALWLAAVRRNSRIRSAEAVASDADLLDHLPKLFTDLQNLLRGNPVDAEVDQDAEKHGDNRWRQGYSLTDVVNELGITSCLLFEHGLDAFEDAHPAACRKALRRAREIIQRFFDDTVSGSVRQYASRQEAQTRGLHERLRAADSAVTAAAQTDRDRLADVFERSPSFIAILSGPDHVFELANDRYRELIGSHRDILHQPVREALPEVAGQGFFELLDRVYATGAPATGNDVRIVLQSGLDEPPQEHFLDFVYQPTRAPDGTVNGVFVHGIDWTARKTAQDALRESEERHRLAIEGAQLGTFSWELSSRRVHWNAKMKEFFFLPPETEMSLELGIAHLHPDDREPTRLAVEAAIREGRIYQIEYRAVAPDDGRVRWIYATGRGFPDPITGEVNRVRGVALDITTHKNAQAHLRELADAMPQIVWSARPDGVLDYSNRRWYEYIDKTEAEVSPADWHVRVHPDDVAGAAVVWGEALATGRPYATEFRVLRADGEYRWFLVRALSIKDADGNVLRWYGTCTDIHDQRALLEQNAQLLDSERAARAEAERTGRMKDEFLATLSHELRTPLNAILGWTQVLRGDPANTEDVEAGLATIERNARAQNQIIEDLLDMSRIISGKVRLDVQRINLAQVVEAAVETVRPAAEAKGIRLQPVLDPQAHTVSGDPNRLQQVFWNLLSNAIKFTPKGGRVQVLLERVHSHLEVNVIDSGEGIAPEFLPHVFDRFRQADATTTRRHGGLGLGLAIVKQLVELHGGGVHIDSAGLGEGTTMRVMLPLTAVQPTPDREDEERRHPRGASEPMSLPLELLRLDGVRVLVVDDEADARALVKRLLEDRGASVRTAGSVAEAMGAFRAEVPEVLVSDIGMPVEDGYSLIRRVRALEPGEGRSTPAIALTAYARSEDRLKAILAGFQMHMAKPVEAVELLAQVASLAGRTGGA